MTTSTTHAGIAQRRMNVGLIGYRNYAGRILNKLRAFPNLSGLTVFHPDRSRLEGAGLSATAPGVALSSRFEDLLDFDAVLVASPNPTHVEYIRRLLAGRPYVYCEKPPAADREGLAYLESLPAEQRRRVYFGFNHRHSDFALQAREFLDNGELGTPVHLRFLFGHGLAFHPRYQTFVKDDPICGIWGDWAIHSLDLALHLLGSPSEVRVRHHCFAQKTWHPDSAAAEFLFPGGVTAQLFYSYAMPFLQQSAIVFTDGYLELKDGVLDLHAPRATFDAQGRHVPSPTRTLSRSESPDAYMDLSLRRSVNEFLQRAGRDEGFPLEGYARALESNRIALEHLAP